MKKSIKNTKSKNQGFTLVELIAVIVIISVISIMSFASITKTIKDSRLKEIEVFETSLKTAAQVYVETNLEDFTNLETVGGSIKITTATLISKGYLDESIKNPSECSLADSRILAKKLVDNTIKYYVFCVGDVIPEETPEPPITDTVYANGTAVYFNPVTGTKCTAGEAVSTAGTKTGCMKWYAFLDGGVIYETINLILDHNTTAAVAWNSTGSNVSGPTNVMTQLASDTNSWSGVPTRSDYTINYGAYKARLITAGEIATITGNSSFVGSTSPYGYWFYFDSNNEIDVPSTTGGSNYAWLFDYTIDCTDYGCNISDASGSVAGYWTSTDVSVTTYGAWEVYRNGILGSSLVNSSDNGIGVRPVITISKSVIG